MNYMKELTNNEATMVSGGWGFLINYFAPKAVDELLDLAKEKEDLFQDTNLSLPYNRL